MNNCIKTFLGLLFISIISGCAPAPPEWGYLQELYTADYTAGGYDCDKMSEDYANHLLAEGYEQRGYTVDVMSGVKRNPPHHAWVRVRKGQTTWYIDPAQQWWSTSNPAKSGYVDVYATDRSWWVER